MQGLDDYLLENEDQIAHAFENLCEGFPWLFEVQTLTLVLILFFLMSVCVQICWRLVEACLDDLIEMIVRDGLNPQMMCEALFLCP